MGMEGGTQGEKVAAYYFISLDLSYLLCYLVFGRNPRPVPGLSPLSRRDGERQARRNRGASSWLLVGRQGCGGS